MERRLQQHKSDLRNCNGNSALVKHRHNTGHAISVINNIYHVNNIYQRKLKEFFLIKNIDSMNVYKASIAIDDFTSSIMHNKVPFLRKFVNKEYFLDSG